VPGFIGFAVGRTVFWDPLVAWRSKKATREQTVGSIAKRYREFVDLFERTTARLPSGLSERTRSGHRSSKEA
jgi:myo-inositol catabolism protein IolC